MFFALPLLNIPVREREEGEEEEGGGQASMAWRCRQEGDRTIGIPNQAGRLPDFVADACLLYNPHTTPFPPPHTFTCVPCMPPVVAPLHGKHYYQTSPPPPAQFIHTTTTTT